MTLNYTLCSFDLKAFGNLQVKLVHYSYNIAGSRIFTGRTALSLIYIYTFLRFPYLCDRSWIKTKILKLIAQSLILHEGSEGWFVVWFTVWKTPQREICDLLFSAINTTITFCDLWLAVTSTLQVCKKNKNKTYIVFCVCVYYEIKSGISHCVSLGLFLLKPLFLPPPYWGFLELEVSIAYKD